MSAAHTRRWLAALTGLGFAVGVTGSAMHVHLHLHHADESRHEHQECPVVQTLCIGWSALPIISPALLAQVADWPVTWSPRWRVPATTCRHEPAAPRAPPLC